MPRPTAKFKRINEKKKTAKKLEFLSAHKSMQWNYVVCSETSRKRLCCLCMCVCLWGKASGKKADWKHECRCESGCGSSVVPQASFAFSRRVQVCEAGEWNWSSLWLRPEQPHLYYSTRNITAFPFLHVAGVSIGAGTEQKRAAKASIVYMRYFIDRTFYRRSSHVSSHINCN